MSDIVFILAMNGLDWGLSIALIALGLSIIFGLLDIINVAPGDFFMVGTVFAWTIIILTGNFWLAFLIVPLSAMLLGSLVERLVIRPVENSAALSIVRFRDQGLAELKGVEQPVPVYEIMGIGGEFRLNLPESQQT